MATVTLSGADDGRTIEIAQGEDVVLQLAENPTTGYRWQVDRRDASLIPREDVYHPASPQRIGSGGVREFRFRGDAPGTARLELKHWQEWEGERSVTERFAIDITIAD